MYNSNIKIVIIVNKRFDLWLKALIIFCCLKYTLKYDLQLKDDTEINKECNELFNSV